MITLYDFALSGNCHIVRLFLSLLGLAYDAKPVDLLQLEQKSASFLQINPFGQVPVLRVGDISLRDSQVILVYLAKQYGDEQWLPLEASKLAEVNAWLSVAANEVFSGPALLWVHYKFGRATPVESTERISANLLNILQQRLSESSFLAGDAISIVDIAVLSLYRFGWGRQDRFKPLSSHTDLPAKYPGITGLCRDAGHVASG